MTDDKWARRIGKQLGRMLQLIDKHSVRTPAIDDCISVFCDVLYTAARIEQGNRDLQALLEEEERIQADAIPWYRSNMEPHSPPPPGHLILLEQIVGEPLANASQCQTLRRLGHTDPETMTQRTAAKVIRSFFDNQK